MTSLNHAYLQQVFHLENNKVGDDLKIQDFLDDYFPLSEGSHKDVAQYRIYFDKLLAHLSSGRCVGLRFPRQLVEYEGDAESPTLITLSNTLQEIELHF